MERIPKYRRPTHPGEVIVEDFLKPLGLTQRELAGAMGVSLVRVNALLNGRRGVTPDTALRLAHVFNTTPEFWLNLQRAVDLYDAKHSPQAKSIAKLPVLVKAS